MIQNTLKPGLGDVDGFIVLMRTSNAYIECSFRADEGRRQMDKTDYFSPSTWLLGDCSHFIQVSTVAWVYCTLRSKASATW